MTELQQLLQRLDDLTAAIVQLTGQVHQVIIMALGEQEEPEAEPMTYMDGTPRQ